MKPTRRRGKKILERVTTSLRARRNLFPREFQLYRFCREFHCLPQEALEVGDAWFELFCDFMRAEGEADMMERKRQQQLPPS